MHGSALPVFRRTKAGILAEPVELLDAVQPSTATTGRPRWPPPGTGVSMTAALSMPSVADLHHAAAAVGHQDVVLAALLVDDHVERPVAVAQLGDGRALDVLARLQVGHRDLDQRRAGVGRQQVGLALDLVGDERPDRRLGLEPAVGAVVDLDAGALVRRR